MLFDSSVRKELARNFGATLVVILTIALTMMMIRSLGLAARGIVAPQDVALLLGFTALSHLTTMLALSLFVAVVIGLGRMYRDSEMAIWFASGVSLAHFVRPVLRMGWPVLVLVGSVALVIWPWSNEQIGLLRTRYEQRSDFSRIAPGSFQSSRDGSRVFFIEREGDTPGQGRNVFVLTRDAQREAVTTAQVGRIETRDGERRLVLDAGQRNELHPATGEHWRGEFQRYVMTIATVHAESAAAMPPKSMSSLELLRQPSAANQGELVWRLGLLLGAANLLLLGIGTAATNPRRASNWNLLFALLAFVIYFNLINLSQVWVGAGRLPMLGALLALHGPALALALVLIRWRDHAAVWQWPARNTRAAP